MIQLLTVLATACGAHQTGGKRSPEAQICRLRASNTVRKIQKIQRWPSSYADIALGLLVSDDARCSNNAALTLAVLGRPSEVEATIRSQVDRHARQPDGTESVELLVAWAYAASRGSPGRRRAVLEELWQMTRREWWIEAAAPHVRLDVVSVAAPRASDSVVALSFVGTDEATAYLRRVQSRPVDFDTYYQSFKFAEFIAELIAASEWRTQNGVDAPYPSSRGGW